MLQQVEIYYDSNIYALGNDLQKSNGEEERKIRYSKGIVVARKTCLVEFIFNLILSTNALRYICMTITYNTQEVYIYYSTLEFLVSLKISNYFFSRLQYL